MLDGVIPSSRARSRTAMPSMPRAANRRSAASRMSSRVAGVGSEARRGKGFAAAMLALVPNERAFVASREPSFRLGRPARRPLLQERREALAHLVGGERFGEHRKIDRGKLPVQVLLHAGPRPGGRLPHLAD